MIAWFGFDHEDAVALIVGALAFLGVSLPAWLTLRRTKTRNGMKLGELAEISHTKLSIINEKADYAIEVGEHLDQKFERHLEEVAPLTAWARASMLREEGEGTA